MIVPRRQRQNAGWSGGPDLDAVALPEPGQLLLLGFGIAGLLALRRSRTKLKRFSQAEK